VLHGGPFPDADSLGFVADRHLSGRLAAMKIRPAEMRDRNANISPKSFSDIVPV